MKYKMFEHESGCEEEVEAEDLPEAMRMARTWLAGGEWGDQESYVTVTITDEAGEETVVEFVVGAPPEPACLKDQMHDWESPYEIVGAIRENPGVWDFGNGQLKIVEACCNCGCLRVRITESLQGQWPRTPERVTYLEPNAKSLAWAGLIEAGEEEL